MLNNGNTLVSQFNEKQAIQALAELYKKYFQSGKPISQAVKNAVRLHQTDLAPLVRLAEADIEQAIMDKLSPAENMLGWLSNKKEKDERLISRLDHLSQRQSDLKWTHKLNRAFLNCSADITELQNVIENQQLLIAERKSDLLLLRHIRAVFLDDSPQAGNDAPPFLDQILNAR